MIINNNKYLRSVIDDFEQNKMHTLLIHNNIEKMYKPDAKYSFNICDIRMTSAWKIADSDADVKIHADIPDAELRYTSSFYSFAYPITVLKKERII